MSTVIKVFAGRRFLPFWGELKSQERFCRTGTRELDSKGWVTVCQVNDVRRGHPWQREQRVWGQETAHLNGPTPCSCNISATPCVAQTWVPRWGSQEELLGIDAGVCEQTGPENCIPAEPCTPSQLWHFPCEFSGCFFTDTINHMLNAGPDEALRLKHRVCSRFV